MRTWKAPRGRFYLRTGQNITFSATSPRSMQSLARIPPNTVSASPDISPTLRRSPIIDFKPSVLDTSLSSLDGGEGSLVGFVTCDGNEYLSSRSDTAAENTFVGKSYVDEAFASEEDNGSSYVEEAGEEYLFSIPRSVPVMP